MSIREWDGAVYDRISTPMEAMGIGVLERLELRGDEVVLDAGCGSGRVTQALSERLPRGRVIAVDASPSMLAAARVRLGATAELRQADLLELELDESVDVVFSTATFHWIHDHDRLFRRLHAMLRPQGRLVAQCGGEGNIRLLRRRADGLLARDPYRRYFADWQAPWYYANHEQTSERLHSAGFRDASCWLTSAPAQPGQPREFLAAIVFGPHLQRLPAQLREPFLDDLCGELDAPVVVDYVRLNIDAVA